MSAFCRTCFASPASADCQWVECFLCYVPGDWEGADLRRLFDQELLAAFETAQHTVVSVHLSSSHGVGGTQFGFVRFDTHDAACLISWRMNGYRFTGTSHVLYMVPHKDSDQRAFYLSLLHESQQVVAHLSQMQQMATLRLTVQRQAGMIHEQGATIAELQRRVVQLEGMLCQTQKWLSPLVAAGRATMLLPRAIKENG
jgi:hypothetical protein